MEMYMKVYNVPYTITQDAMVTKLRLLWRRDAIAFLHNMEGGATGMHS